MGFSSILIGETLDLLWKIYVKMGLSGWLGSSKPGGSYASWEVYFLAEKLPAGR